MGFKAALLFATSGHSGVDRVVANLLPEFAKSAYSFDLLLLKGHGPYLDFVPNNITIKIPAGSKKTVLPALTWYLLRNQPYSLLTANHQLNRAALLARRLSRSKTRIAIRMGMSLSAKGKTMKSRERKTFIRSMQHWYPQADAVIAPSNGVGEDLVRLAGVPRQRLHVIRNPIVNQRFYSLSQEKMDHPWLTSPNCPVILSVGSLELRKDFTTLLRAFSIVRAKRHCRLLILGKGPEKERLLRLAEDLGMLDDLDMPGFKPNPYPFMRQADVFVLSSRREGASAVIVEALACGTPVVSTDCPSGPAETLQNGKLGRLVPVGAYEAMAKAIADTLDNPPGPELLRQAAQEHRTDRAAEKYLQAMGLEQDTNRF